MTPETPAISVAKARSSLRQTALLTNIWAAALCVHLGWVWGIVGMLALTAVVQVAAAVKMNTAEKQAKAVQSALDRPRSWP